MSEQIKNAEETKREEYTVVVTDPEDFEADASIKVLTSDELGKLANQYFHLAFADYVGCEVVMNNGQMSFNLVFSHDQHVEGAHYAVDMAGKDNVANNVLARSRKFDRLVREGDRYHITEDGKDLIKNFLFPRLVDRKTGKANWGQLVSEASERLNYYGPSVQYTKISNIDPKAICFAVFGRKDADGSSVDYSVEVKGVADSNAYAAGNAPRNYVLYITKVNNEHMRDTYKKLGIGIVGSTIIR